MTLLDIHDEKIRNKGRNKIEVEMKMKMRWQ